MLFPDEHSINWETQRFTPAFFREIVSLSFFFLSGPKSYPSFCVSIISPCITMYHHVPPMSISGMFIVTVEDFSDLLMVISRRLPCCEAGHTCQLK